ncbi:hypothetical protein B0H19DRAFT_140054 [Mycena capillaripes]|nr:hypothetical protein B0H19DRAFT_140054 [Mycena capillaripes]
MIVIVPCWSLASPFVDIEPSRLAGYRPIVCHIRVTCILWLPNINYIHRPLPYVLMPLSTHVHRPVTRRLLADTHRFFRSITPRGNSSYLLFPTQVARNVNRCGACRSHEPPQIICGLLSAESTLNAGNTYWYCFSSCLSLKTCDGRARVSPTPHSVSIASQEIPALLANSRHSSRAPNATREHPAVTFSTSTFEMVLMAR